MGSCYRYRALELDCAAPRSAKSDLRLFIVLRTYFIRWGNQITWTVIIGRVERWKRVRTFIAPLSIFSLDFYTFTVHRKRKICCIFSFAFDGFHSVLETVQVPLTHGISQNLRAGVPIAHHEGADQNKNVPEITTYRRTPLRVWLVLTGAVCINKYAPPRNHASVSRYLPFVTVVIYRRYQFTDLTDSGRRHDTFETHPRLLTIARPKGIRTQLRNGCQWYFPVGDFSHWFFIWLWN